MARPEDPTKRPRLLKQIIEYLEVHRLSELRFRSLAQHCGVSTQVLVYQFGTREQLVEAVVTEVEREMRAVAEDNIDAGVPAAVREFSQWLQHHERAATLLSISAEWQMLARQANRENDGATETVDGRRFWIEWIDLFAHRFRADGIPPQEAATLATLAHAALLGLSLDYWVSADNDRIGRAFEELAAGIEERLASALGPGALKPQ